MFGSKPIGIIVHGSRSNAASRTLQQEYDGTRTYAENSYIAAGDYYTGWNCTIGPKQWSVHFPADYYGWNAGQDGAVRIGLEVAQAIEAWDITDDQCLAFGDCYHSYIVPRWGPYNLRRTGVLVRHSTLPQGVSAGKTDVFNRNDVARWADLVDRFARACGQ